MNKLLEALSGQLIVSCQAEAGFPLNKPEHLVALAKTALMGGAAGIRASKPENIRAMRQAIDQPIIGIFKKAYPGFEVYITPTFEDAEQVIRAGADIIALDATSRPRPGSLPLKELIQKIKSKYKLPIMADIATLEEGLQAVAFGADLIGTTLSGYTAASEGQPMPNLALVAELASQLDVPIIAEGGISTPEEARAALVAGAYAVVVGSMITRPHLITERFVSALKPKVGIEHVAVIDIGGTKISFGVVDPHGKVLKKGRIKTPVNEGGKQILSQIVLKMEQFLDDIPHLSPRAMGISTGGQVSASGELVGGTDMIPNWIGTPLKSVLRDHFGLPVAVVNDGHAASLAEASYGAGQGKTSMLCVVIGTGLGGGLVIDGQLQHGANGLAGSIGQIKITSKSGDYVPLEEMVSGPGLVRAYNRLSNKTTVLDSGEQVSKLAHDGDDTAMSVVQEMGTYLGLGLSHALHVYDADCVVVGGSVAQLGDLLLDSARKSLEQFGHASVAKTPIMLAKLGNQAQLIGASLYVRLRLLG